MKKEPFIFTEDLMEILKNCRESAVEENLQEISLNNFKYHFFDYYVNELSQSSMSYDTLIVSILRDISAKSKLNVLTNLRDNYLNSKKTEIVKISNVSSKDLTFISKEVLEVFEEASALLEGGSNKVISRYIFYSFLAHDSGDMKDLKISSEEFMKEIQNNKDSEDSVGTEDPDESDLADLFNKYLGAATEGVNSTTADNSDDDSQFESWGESGAISGTKADPDSPTPTLDQFSVDMTKKAKNKEYDPVIGRDDIVDSMIEILCKRRKPNVALTGSAGTGKSAIVEHLAQRISDSKVPTELLNKRICSLNLNDLVAGTKYRGEYEERLQGIIKEVCEDKNTIIFIDELHNLVGNGNSSGNGDAANILKPYLARGEFQCIGSTTEEEYHKFIEKDAALNRRFTQIEVVEPSVEGTIKILTGLKKEYETFHHVKFGKDTIKACVEWSQRYINDKFQPDKSVEVMDFAGAIVKLRQIQDTKLRDELGSKLESLSSEKINLVTSGKVESDEEISKVKSIQDEINDIKTQLEDEVARENDQANNPKNWPNIEVGDVAQALSKMTRIPIDTVKKSDREKLKTMKSDLEKVVIGQQEAIDSVFESISENVLGLRTNYKRPIGNLLMVGPSGVGKTLICKELTRIFFGSDQCLVRLDGNALKDETSVSNLLGAAPGYVGFNDNEPLLLQVKRKPNCVFLVDEVEKMHPKVFDLFLNILDEGNIKLNDGTQINFGSSIVIFTGNIGTKDLSMNKRMGFGELSQEDKNKRNESIIKKAIENTFRPEFIGRLNKIVYFNELSKADLNKIFNLELNKLKNQFKKNGYQIKVTNKLRDYIVSLCDPKYGARNLKNNIESNIVSNVSRFMISDTDSTKFLIDYDGEKVVVSSAEKKTVIMNTTISEKTV